MKRIASKCVLALLLLCAAAPAPRAQSKKVMETLLAESIKAAIQSGNYTISVHQAIPITGDAIELTSPYSLRVRGDSVISYLPYYGRGYGVSFTGGNALNFRAKLDRSQVKLNSKGNRFTIELTTHTGEDEYTFMMRVFTNGSATITTTMRKRQAMRFYGVVDLTP
ncbi:MAG: DUF4251 domain-containing protein [Prevotellaceae bacterium]|jgi:hypothetical protein|nr:DUF4251 domain-containing protein [Prevotellaceae bacterium]